MDAGATVTIIIQSVALIFMAGVGWATLREHSREIRELNDRARRIESELGAVRVEVASLKRCRA